MSIRPLPRLRRLAVALLAVTGLLGAGVGPAAAATSSSGPPPAYLALGDSVPFGYYNSPYAPATPEWRAFYSDATQFRSYADDVAAARHLHLVNASCPGETSGSFINTDVPSFACENLYRLLNPLHVTYLRSQLDFATNFLRTTPNVRLVTIQLGANDVFLCQSSAPDGCTSPTDIQTVAAHVAANLDIILTRLRATGYRGTIDVVDYYSLNYADQQGTAGTLVLDKAIDSATIAHHDTVVSGFAAFLPIAWIKGGGDSRAAGLVRPAPDVHPTPLGHSVLAAAVQLAGAF